MMSLMIWTYVYTLISCHFLPYLLSNGMNNYIKCSKSLFFKEMELKITITLQIQQNGLTISGKDKDDEQQQTSHMASGSINF